MQTADRRAVVRAPSFRCDLLGALVEVAAPAGEPLHWLQWALSGFLTADDAGESVTQYALVRQSGDAWVLTRDDVALRTDGDLATAVLALEWQLVTDAIARRRDLFHLHGAALATPDGTAALLVVGVSGSGKTTLTLGLMAAGFRPFGDDVIFLDPSSLTLLPLRRAFHVRAPTQGLVPLPEWDAPWTDPTGTRWYLPPRWATVPSPPIRAIVFPEVLPDAALSLTPLTPAEGAHRLLSHSVTLESSPALALAAVRLLTAQATCYRLTVGDPLATVAQVSALVSPADHER
ncbi:MAG TPA: hypothetical protein VIC60_13875 [Thermomicrobiales bacterium]|jgi:hypothetical protein